MKTKIFFSVALTATLLLSSCGKKSSGGLPAFADNEYPVETVQAQNSVMQTTYPATLKGIQDVEIRPKVSGFITKVNVREGQTVGAGQVLFVLDNETYQAAVRQAQAAVNTAQANLNTAKLTYDNSKQLFDKKIIGDFQLQSAQNSYTSAQAALSQAKASLASAKETLSFCYVKSPASGVIGELPFKTGALVSASSAEPLTTVSNISTIEAYFSMTEKDVLSMSKAAGSVQQAIASMPVVKLQLADGSIYNHPGKVTKVSGVIDATTGSIQMIAQFSNPEKLLKSGGSGSVVIPTENNGAIVVPMSATVEVQNKIFVYVLGKDNKVKYTEVKVDPQNDGTNYVVTSGLKVGDRYVTNGLTKLSDGMEIKAITKAQYEKKIQEAQELGKANGNANDFIKAMKK